LPRGTDLLNGSRPLLSLLHDKLDPSFLFLSVLTFSHPVDLPKRLNRFRASLEEKSRATRLYGSRRVPTAKSIPFRLILIVLPC
jgi:hypothetical protein